MSEKFTSYLLPFLRQGRYLADKLYKIRAADCIKAARFPDPLPLVPGRFVPGPIVPGRFVPSPIVPGPIVPASSLPVLLPLLPA